MKIKDQILKIDSDPSRKRVQYSSQRSGTTSQKISLKAIPIPISITMGKKMTPRTQAPPYRSDMNSKENPKRPAIMQTINIPKMTSKSLQRKMKIISTAKSRKSISLKGDLKMQAKVSPHVSSQQEQSQQGSPGYSAAGAPGCATTGTNCPFSSCSP